MAVTDDGIKTEKKSSSQNFMKSFAKSGKNSATSVMKNPGKALAIGAKTAAQQYLKILKQIFLLCGAKKNCHTDE